MGGGVVCTCILLQKAQDTNREENRVAKVVTKTSMREEYNCAMGEWGRGWAVVQRAPGPHHPQRVSTPRSILSSLLWDAAGARACLACRNYQRRF